MRSIRPSEPKANPALFADAKHPPGSPGEPKANPALFADAKHPPG